MKSIVIASAALAAIVATPALAQNYHGQYGQDRAGYVTQAPTAPWNARGAFAQSYQNAFNNPYVVIEDGKVIGADPDPNVRLQIRRDYQASDY